MEALRGQADSLGLGQRFVLVGNRSDPQCFQPGLDILMLTSVNEGTPIVILEAGACARPVLATAVGGVPDMLGPVAREMPGGFALRARGITAPSGDAPALAAGLAWLLDHPQEAVALGQALQDYVRAHHAKERLLDDLERLYRQAVQS
jgi:glycosyltransferase involved in cell wall biosynthesis